MHSLTLLYLCNGRFKLLAMSNNSPSKGCTSHLHLLQRPSKCFSKNYRGKGCGVMHRLSSIHI